MIKKVGIDDFILECWSIDDSGWRFRLVSDLWWEIVAESEELGVFKAVSDYSKDVELTLGKLLNKIKEAKVGSSN